MNNTIEHWQSAKSAVRKLNETLDLVARLLAGVPDNLFEQMFGQGFKK